MRAKILLKAVMSYVFLIRLAGEGQTPAKAEYLKKHYKSTSGKPRIYLDNTGDFFDFLNRE
jgi:hypothetical protein